MKQQKKQGPQEENIVEEILFYLLCFLNIFKNKNYFKTIPSQKNANKLNIKCSYC